MPRTLRAKGIDFGVGLHGLVPWPWPLSLCAAVTSAAEQGPTMGVRAPATKYAEAP